MMQVRQNKLKAALARGQVQHGIWLASGSAALAELAGGIGFDWCLIDAEHAPNGISDLSDQLRALQAAGCEAVVRVPEAAPWMIKQVLDQGAQSVLVPMVHDAETAQLMADAMRYPPEGDRGMGAIMSRASGFGAIADYAHAANDQVCLMVQVESSIGVAHVDAIAAVKGVDGVFVGPADLSADMGFVGRPDDPVVVAAIDHVIARTKHAGKAPGIVTFQAEQAAEYAQMGVTFLGVGGDVAVLRKGLVDLCAAVSGKPIIRE